MYFHIEIDIGFSRSRDLIEQRQTIFHFPFHDPRSPGNHSCWSIDDFLSKIFSESRPQPLKDRNWVSLVAILPYFSERFRV